MRAGEDPANTVPGNKAAREQGFDRLVKLLHEMKSAPMAGILRQNKSTAGKEVAHAVECHSPAPASL